MIKIGLQVNQTLERNSGIRLDECEGIVVLADILV
jgi:hypothetical protein